MNMSNMKNMIVLKNLPSNLVEEAIIVLKENKKVKKYQYAENEAKKNVESCKENIKKDANNSDYIIKEAENVISQYISKLEMKSPKWKNDMNKLQKRYIRALILNYTLAFVIIVNILMNII